MFSMVLLTGYVFKKQTECCRHSFSCEESGEGSKMDLVGGSDSKDERRRAFPAQSEEAGMENRVCTKVWKQESYVWASPQPQGVITTELGKVYWGHFK